MLISRSTGFPLDEMDFGESGRRAAIFAALNALVKRRVSVDYRDINTEAYVPGRS